MTKDFINNYVAKNLSDKRKVHTEGVRKTAIELAEIYGIDKEKAEIAALCHDLYRGVPVDALNYYVNHLGLDKKYLNNPNLAHGKIAAEMIQREFGIDDREIIDAVSFHTTGRAAMSPLEKIIYIADATEPNRDYPGVEELRKLAPEDLDGACLLSLERTIEYVTKQGNYLDEDTLHARDYLKKQGEKINDK